MGPRNIMNDRKLNEFYMTFTNGIPVNRDKLKIKLDKWEELLGFRDSPEKFTKVIKMSERELIDKNLVYLLNDSEFHD